MANALYGKGRQAFLEGTIAYLSDNIKLCLVNTASYTLSINVDQYLSAIPGGAIVATSGNFASKTSTLGVADAADLTLTAVSGSQCSLIVIYKDTGSSATSPLIAAIDTATGLPVTPNGGDITVQWDNGANKIWKLFEAIDPALVAEIGGWARFKGTCRRGLRWLAGSMPEPEPQEAFSFRQFRIIQHPPKLIEG